MQILKEVKIGRLVLALVVTLLLADTMPHPSLSAGLLESSFGWAQSSLSVEKQPETAIADSINK
ncbi:hypothetical protein PN498_23010 [Oscillatoria sp. CS-180]|uniref:hypothetical protein n=1 Tax=Oscillatoria sp. CS-180 TaxID=3021720 RepID=UPI00232E31DE|nr:hypothetical protein [Oscillatoria sp. CS-180]MDB9528882.1 hypothetical protein [Oscillatoria sp. CS-180]